MESERFKGPEKSGGRRDENKSSKIEFANFCLEGFVCLLWQSGN